MSPESMEHAVRKVTDSGNDNVWITDRGSRFGYQDMVIDFRGIPVMKSMAPTILDVTHSLQQAARVSKRTAYFHLGRLVEVGLTDKLFMKPQHEMTNNYITGRFG